EILSVRYPRPDFVVRIRYAGQAISTVGDRVVTAAQAGGGGPGCHIDNVTIFTRRRPEVGTRVRPPPVRLLELVPRVGLKALGFRGGTNRRRHGRHPLMCEPRREHTVLVGDVVVDGAKSIITDIRR